MRIKLYDWAPSPFSLKVRAILTYKGIAHDRVSMLAPAHWWAVRSRGKIGKAPALEIDGRLYVDSTDIAYELEARVPLPAVIPGDARERAFCHAVEEWSDESLYFSGLYFQWHDPEGRKMVPQAFGRSAYGRLMYQVYLRRILRQLHGQGTSRKPPAHALTDLRRHLEAIAGLIQSNRFVLGAQPYLCDFALFGQLVYLGRTPVGSQELRKHPAIEAYIARMKALRAPE
jgi:glutathione S-transferase